MNKSKEESFSILFSRLVELLYAHDTDKQNEIKRTPPFLAMAAFEVALEQFPHLREHCVSKSLQPTHLECLVDVGMLQTDMMPDILPDHEHTELKEVAYELATLLCPEKK